MDLWIRSQNKEVLVKANCLQIKDNTILNHSGTNFKEILGEYKTKERALEILNDIHHNILEQNIEERLSYEQADIKIKNIIANNMLKIYQMPKE